ncbi:phosphoglycerate mutase family protein [Gordonia sp. PP30]|uniref:histidine phosphatase family protein n=1 Tax=unclassified Gordonia (in: high G+C Gram-positive bacteria) TaxID=2657482 RepID=UPI00200043C3|nr:MULTISPECIES: histidine phosphatase family protein [unclassified Gordonia (in: high G+C Gram-positive bacteria)]UQE76233.1 phosphoglycerate mutase family protein [Gordonia sp. PP30]
MLVVVAGRTAPNRSVRFGGEHDPLDARGIASVEALIVAPPGRSATRAGPEASVRQSAGLLGRSYDVDPGLATLDVGSWRGRPPEEIPPGELGAWFADPDAVPHGGESVRAFVERIRDHVAGLEPETVLVVAAPVAQALLCGGPDVFFAADVRPASTHSVDGLGRGSR